MTDEEISELARLIQEYDAKHGEGKGDKISGALMFSLSVVQQIKIFRKAQLRQIVVKNAPGVIDGVRILYKS